MADAPRNFEDLGPNEWLVDELYEQYQRDKSSVDRAWWEFFEDYKPMDGSGPRGRTQPAPAAPAPRAGRAPPALGSAGHRPLALSLIHI